MNILPVIFELFQTDTHDEANDRFSQLFYGSTHINEKSRKQVNIL
jgi:hypothetical protein